MKRVWLWTLMVLTVAIVAALVININTRGEFFGRAFMSLFKAAEDSKRKLPAYDSRLLHRTKGDTDRVYGIAFSPDGKWVFTCGSDGLKQWDAASYRLVHTQTFDLANLGYPHAVYTVAVARNEPLVYLGTLSLDVQIWNYETKQIVGTIPTRQRWPPSIPALALSCDGTILAIAENGAEDKGMQIEMKDFSILLWNVLESRIRDRLTGHGHSVHCLAFFPGDEYLFADGNSVIWDWDVGTILSRREHFELQKDFRGDNEPRQSLAIFRSKLPYGFKRNVDANKWKSLTFTKRWLAENLIGKHDFVIQAVDDAAISSGKTGKVVAAFKQFGNGMPTTTVAVSPDRRVVVTGGDGHAMRGGFGNNDDQSDRNLCWWRIAE